MIDLECIRAERNIDGDFIRIRVIESHVQESRSHFQRT